MRNFIVTRLTNRERELDREIDRDLFLKSQYSPGGGGGNANCLLYIYRCKNIDVY